MFHSSKEDSSRHSSARHSRRRDSVLYSKRRRRHGRSEPVEEEVHRKNNAECGESRRSTESNGTLQSPSTHLADKAYSSSTELKNAKREPISLEDILKKKKEEEEAAQKPRFVAKSERERQALERLYERRNNAESMKVDDSEAHRNSVSKSVTMLSQQSTSQNQRYPRELEDTEESQHMKELLRKHYMKEKDTKSRVTKPSERFRFRFEWDSSEDTLNSEDYRDLSSFEVPLLFGRGHRGGMDPTVTKTTESCSKSNNRLKDSNRLSSGRVEISLEDPVHRRNKKDMRHWSEKSREEMTERDWRIFREDHSIAYRGGKAPFPVSFALFHFVKLRDLQGSELGRNWPTSGSFGVCSTYCKVQTTNTHTDGCYSNRTSKA